MKTIPHIKINEQLAFLLKYYFLLLALPAIAQEDFRNSVYVELGGTTGTYSLNYERIFSKNVPIKVGISFLPGDASMLVMAGKYFGSQAHHFELLGGFSYGREREVSEVSSTNYHYIFGTTFIGYRYQKPKNRFLFRAGYAAYFSERVGHRAGVSAGYRF